MSQTINNIELSIFSSRMNAICEEMGEVLRLSAFSTNIKDRLDFSCAIFDANGELCAQAAHIPVHLGSMAYAMRDIVAQLKWQSGDMYAINDPYKGGTHLPDVTIIAPLYVEQKLTAFVVNRAHHADIGASVPGSMPLSTHLDEEGVVISLQKIVSDHQVDLTALNTVCRHMSDSHTSRCDFLAQISANNTGIKRLKSLILEHSTDYFCQALRALNQYGRRFARSLLDQLPKGSYKFVDYLDNDGMGQQKLPIKLNLYIHDHEIIADFSGTCRQVKGNVNCPVSVTAAAVFYVFRCLMPEETPVCFGSFSLIKIKATPGSIVNAVYPAAVAAGNVETSMRIVDVVLGALVQAIPDRIPAASYGSMNNIAMGSFSAEYTWNYYETIGGGMGASSVSSGLSAVQTHMTNTLNTPIESLETHFPLRIKEYAIRYGSGGKGKRRGGDGIIRSYQMKQPTKITLLTERRNIPPWGLPDHKNNARSGVNLLNGKELPAKTTFTAYPGDVLTIKTPGGGGYDVEGIG